MVPPAHCHRQCTLECLVSGLMLPPDTSIDRSCGRVGCSTSARASTSSRAFPTSVTAQLGRRWTQSRRACDDEKPGTLSPPAITVAVCGAAVLERTPRARLYRCKHQINALRVFLWGTPKPALPKWTGEMLERTDGKRGECFHSCAEVWYALVHDSSFRICSPSHLGTKFSRQGGYLRQQRVWYHGDRWRPCCTLRWRVGTCRRARMGRAMQVGTPAMGRQ